MSIIKTGCGIEELRNETAERLKRALPQCEIIWDPESSLPNRRRA